MNAEQIKKLVDEGKKVFIGNEGYVVIKDCIGQYLIKCLSNDYIIGLTSIDGKILNFDESEAFSLDDESLLSVSFSRHGEPDKTSAIMFSDFETSPELKSFIVRDVNFHHEAVAIKEFSTHGFLGGADLALIKLYNSLSNGCELPDTHEQSFIINGIEDCLLNIASDGSYLCLTKAGNEFAYWSAAEFEESPCEVVSAFCGALMSILK